MNGIYKITFEVECCEDRIEKFLNHKRWGKDSRTEGDMEEFVTDFAKRHIEAGFCRVKLPLKPYMYCLDWCFKWGRKGMNTCEIVRIGQTEDL